MPVRDEELRVVEGCALVLDARVCKGLEERDEVVPLRGRQAECVDLTVLVGVREVAAPVVEVDDLGEGQLPAVVE